MTENVSEQPKDVAALDEFDGDELHTEENIGEEVSPEHGLDVNAFADDEEDNDDD